MNDDNAGAQYPQGSGPGKSSVYFADTFQVTADGPAVDGEHVDGTRLDLGFVTDEIDLRFSDDIAVAFRKTGDHRTITYREQDSPVVGVGADSQYVGSSEPRRRPRTLSSTWRRGRMVDYMGFEIDDALDPHDHRPVEGTDRTSSPRR